MVAKKIRNWKRQYWFGLVAFLLAGLVFAANAQAWAAPERAPNNQTVPQPTATSKPSELPTATPSKDDSDDNDSDDDDSDDDDSDDNASSQPDPTATPEPTPPPVESDAGVHMDANADEGSLSGEVVVARLNVREGPGTDFEIIGTLSNGETVALLGRSADSVWWAVCCVGELESLGWVSAQFIRPTIGRIDANNALPVVASLDELLAESAPSSPIVDEASERDTTEPATTELLLEITQSPPYVLQGEQVELTLVVTNVGEEDAQTVVLSDQLPDGLTFVAAEADGDGATSQKSGNDGAVIVLAKWPQLAAGASATAALTLDVAADHPSGAVIDNLAAVNADNAEDATAGISIGTVPTLLPDF